MSVKRGARFMPNQHRMAKFALLMLCMSPVIVVGMISGSFVEVVFTSLCSFSSEGWGLVRLSERSMLNSTPALAPTPRSGVRTKVFSPDLAEYRDSADKALKEHDIARDICEKDD
jgi:hypothetical protein